MAKQKGNLYDIHSILQPVRSLRMPELMGMEIQWHISAVFMGCLCILFQHLADGRLSHFSVTSGVPRIKNIGLRIRCFPMELS